jgi:hypothetical protein
MEVSRNYAEEYPVKKDSRLPGYDWLKEGSQTKLLDKTNQLKEDLKAFFSIKGTKVQIEDEYWEKLGRNGRVFDELWGGKVESFYQPDGDFPGKRIYREDEGEIVVGENSVDFQERLDGRYKYAEAYEIVEELNNKYTKRLERAEALVIREGKLAVEMARDVVEEWKRDLSDAMGKDTYEETGEALIGMVMAKFERDIPFTVEPPLYNVKFEHPDFEGSGFHMVFERGSLKFSALTTVPSIQPVGPPTDIMVAREDYTEPIPVGTTVELTEEGEDGGEGEVRQGKLHEELTPDRNQARVVWDDKPDYGNQPVGRGDLLKLKFAASSDSEAAKNHYGGIKESKLKDARSSHAEKPGQREGEFNMDEFIGKITGIEDMGLLQSIAKTLDVELGVDRPRWAGAPALRGMIFNELAERRRQPEELQRLEESIDSQLARSLAKQPGASTFEEGDAANRLAQLHVASVTRAQAPAQAQAPAPAPAQAQALAQAQAPALAQAQAQALARTAAAAKIRASTRFGSQAAERRSKALGTGHYPVKLGPTHGHGSRAAAEIAAKHGPSALSLYGNLTREQKLALGYNVAED